jgi:hypothetical protein
MTEGIPFFYDSESIQREINTAAHTVQDPHAAWAKKFELAGQVASQLNVVVDAVRVYRQATMTTGPEKYGRTYLHILEARARMFAALFRLDEMRGNGG